MADTHSNGALLDRTVTVLLRLLAVLIVAVTFACFAQSYRQLFDWSTAHHIPLWVAPAWPAMLDTFVIIGEIVLFVSLVRDWPRRTRMLAWGMSVAGLTASLAAQWLYLPPSASWLDRGTAVVAPVGATIGLAAGLVVLKWVASDHRGRVSPRVSPASPEPVREVMRRQKVSQATAVKMRAYAAERVKAYAGNGYGGEH